MPCSISECMPLDFPLADGLSASDRVLLTNEEDFNHVEGFDGCIVFNNDFSMLKYVSPTPSEYERVVYNENCEMMQSSLVKTLADNQLFSDKRVVDESLASEYVETMAQCRIPYHTSKYKLYPSDCFNKKQYKFNPKTNSLQLYSYTNAQCNSGEKKVKRVDIGCGCRNDAEGNHYTDCESEFSYYVKFDGSTFTAKELRECVVEDGKYVTYTSSQPKELLITTTPNKDRIRTNDGKTTFEYRTLTSDNELTSEEQPRYVGRVYTDQESCDDYDGYATFYYSSECLGGKRYVPDPDNEQIVLKFRGETCDGDGEVLSTVACGCKTDGIAKRATHSLCTSRDPESEVYIFILTGNKYQRYYLGQCIELNDGKVVKYAMTSSTPIRMMRPPLWRDTTTSSGRPVSMRSVYQKTALFATAQIVADVINATTRPGRVSKCRLSHHRLDFSAVPVLTLFTMLLSLEHSFSIVSIDSRVFVLFSVLVIST